MKELLPIHHHHHLEHRVRSIICTELHSPIECCLNFFFVICRVVWRQRCGLLGQLRLPRTMIPACIHLCLCYAFLPETWGHRNVIATLQITYTYNVKEFGMVGVISCLHLFFRRHCGLFRLFGLWLFMIVVVYLSFVSINIIDVNLLCLWVP